MNEIIYSDFDVNLKINPITHDIIKKTNEESVKQSLKLLLKTSFYDRKWHPEIGCELDNLLFGQLDPFELYSTQENLKELITKYEPRIKINDINVSVSPKNQFAVIVTINYTIIVSNKTDTFVLTINRLR